MGGLKREIAFIGDTLNTTARLLDVARDTEQDVVVSGELAARLPLPSGLLAIPLGAVSLRGKERPLSVVALRASRQPDASGLAHPASIRP